MKVRGYDLVGRETVGNSLSGVVTDTAADVKEKSVRPLSSKAQKVVVPREAGSPQPMSISRSMMPKNERFPGQQESSLDEGELPNAWVRMNLPSARQHLHLAED